MLRALFRLLLAIGGGAAASIVVALIEARSVWSGAEGAARAQLGGFALVVAELGVLFPMAMLIGGAVGVAALVLDPGEPTSPAQMLAALRRGSVVDRLRAASIAPVAVLVVFGWCLASAHAARATLSAGAPASTGSRPPTPPA